MEDIGPKLVAAVYYDDEAGALAILSKPNLPYAVLNCPDSVGNLPLVLACMKNPKVAMRLIEAGADTNKADEAGWTPLSAATHFAKERHLDMAAVIRAIDAKAVVSEAELGAKLVRAVYDGKEDLVDEILSKQPLSQKVLGHPDSVGNRPLILACLKSPRMALALIEAGADTDIKDDAGWTVKSAVLYAASKGINMDKVLALLAQKDAAAKGFDMEAALAIVPTESDPIRKGSPEAVQMRILADVLNSMAAADIPAHPAAADFPGVPAIEEPWPMTTIARTVNMTYGKWGERLQNAAVEKPLWRSTGAYVPPGVVATVTMTAEAIASGVMVQVGCHTDTLWEHESYTRFPQLVRTFHLSAPEEGETTSTTQVANAFGGLVYVAIPAGTKLGEQEVIIDNVLPAPLFILGTTASDDDWETGMHGKYAPAPWGEIVGHNLIYTLPSDLLRGVSEPDKITSFWDRVLDDNTRLVSGLPRLRPDRFVCDRDISVGSGHAGYPLMGKMDWAEGSLKVPYGLDVYPDLNVWGYFHEIGHNYQEGDWTLEGMTEVTVNLFSVYTIENNGMQAFPRMQDEIYNAAETAKLHKEFVASHAKTFLDHVWAGLHFFIVIQRAFGWDAFKRFFASYRALSEAERPKTEAEKMQQLLLRLSKATSHNLAAYFAAWGFKADASTLAAIKDLKPFVWTPGTH